MLQQGMTDLDLDAFFDVTSNSMHPHHQHQHQQQHQQHHYEQAIHPTQQLDMPQRFNAPLLIPQLNQQQQQQQQQPYYMPQQQQQQPSFEMFDWCFKQQQPSQPQQQHAQILNNAHQTPASTPGGDGINRTSPRPEYFYSAQQQSQHHHHPAQPNSTTHSPQFQVQQTMNEYINASYVPSSEQAFPPQQQQEQPALIATTSNAPAIPPVNVAMATTATGLPTPVSDVIFPGTPQSRTSIQSSESDSPCSTSEPPATVSPALDIPPPPLTNAFAAIDQLGKLNQDEAIPELSKENYHKTRHWGKTKRSDSVSSNTSNMVAAAVAAVAARSTPRNTSPIETGCQLKKVAHNAIERRYRNNINDRIRDLKNVVPALYKAKIREKKSRSNSKSNTEEEDDEAATAAAESSDEDDSLSTKTGEIVDGVEVAKKLNKATILHKATEYIHHLKHTNELAERENQVLQQILAQMPGGAKVLARFQIQKLDFQQAEQQRLCAERKESMERERAERQRMLRERAAQRAALAELLPKTERRPYRRRAKKNAATTTSDDKQKSTKENTQEQAQDQQIAAGSQTTRATSLPEPSADTSGNKAFMVMFLCLTIVSPLSFENTAAQPYHGGRALSQQQQQISSRSFPFVNSPSAFENCLWAKIAFTLPLICYFLGHYVLQKRQRRTLH